ncbi:hypothetical protein RhiirA1_479598 [Rhizophagus irregularis]|uniref:Uncharacterized protein n=1 Tax=Rhizophagus irregularis TaxID=588596 RepID=A0A2N0QQH5_9GLOM|nr:hypothetical protein RhiirA1_479598 [Rhizophagus irregularis]
MLYNINNVLYNICNKAKYYQELELDILYYNYGFAIEVQGEQHEKFNKFFHKEDPKLLRLGG